MLPSTSFNHWPDLSARRTLMIVMALIMLALAAAAIFIAFHVYSANSIGPFLAPSCGAGCQLPPHQYSPQLASQVGRPFAILAVVFGLS